MGFFIVAALVVFGWAETASGFDEGPRDAHAVAGEGPWTPVCKHFGKSAAADASGAERFCLGKDVRRKVLIATVPDPELTHLSLTFDRMVESITRAASDGDLVTERYTFDSYWFPWLAGLKQDLDTEKRKAADAERGERINMPGLLLFRKQGSMSPEELLLVFLVGETPTSGINRFALEAASNYANDLAKDYENDNLPICGNSRCRAILGPTFTGSVPSLSDFLQSVSPKMPAVVITGTVTGFKTNPFKDPLNTRFFTTIESNANRFNALTTYLKSRTESFNQGQDFAILTEDETAYGEGLFKNVLTLRYPRGISRLRNSLQEIPGSGTKPAEVTPYTALALSLRDEGQDSIPSLSAQQTPVSQEAVLSELAATLRRERIRYVGIIATDPLDELFLSKAIRALAPNVRIVVFHADLLLARQAREWGLSGILAVTSYPLIARNQFVEDALEPNRTQFPDEGSEGVYNAMRSMLLRYQFCQSTPSVCTGHAAPNRDLLMDYFDPFPETGHKAHRPPVWITMLGRDEWWPIATLTAYDDTLVLSGPEPSSHPNKEIFSAESSLRLWTIVYWVLLLACSAHILLILIMNVGNLAQPQGRWRHVTFRPYGVGFKPALAKTRRTYLAAASLVVATVCGALAATQASSGLAGWMAVLALLIAFIAAVQAVWIWGITSLKLLFAFSVAWLIAAVLLPVTVWLGRGANHTGNWLEFSGYRAVHVESGTSPLLPVLALLAAIWFFARLRLIQCRIAEDWHCTFPLIGPMKLNVLLGNPDNPIPSFGFAQFAGCVAGLSAWLLFFTPWNSLRTIEGAAYDKLATVLSSLVLALLALAVIQLLGLWLRLRKLLRALERHPLRYAFSRLPKEFTWTSVWSGDPRPQLLMPAKLIQLLEKVGSTFSMKINTEFQRFTATTQPYSNAYKKVDAINLDFNSAAELIASQLLPIWEQGASDTLAARETHLSPYAPAEEFLALRFVSWIRYSLFEARSLLKFLVYGFVLFIAGLTSYPFEGHGQISLALISIFIAGGACVLFVFAEMDRDPLLSRLSETDANMLGREFVNRAVTYGAFPLLSLLATQVPEIGNFLLKWIQPALEAVK